MARDYNSDYLEAVIYSGQIFIKGKRYVPLSLYRTNVYDGRLDGIPVIIKFNLNHNNEIEDSMIELIETKLARDKRVKKRKVFHFEEPDKENGKPLWPWWIKDISYVPTN